LPTTFAKYTSGTHFLYENNPFMQIECFQLHATSFYIQHFARDSQQTQVFVEKFLFHTA